MRYSVVGLLAAVALSGAAQAQRTPPAASAPQFITVSDDAILSSRVVGLTVQNANGDNLGRIEDLAFEGGQIVGVVLSVGDALGTGRRYVAIDPSSISINYTKDENKWRATMNARTDQLRSAPEFRYEGKWKR